MKKMVSTNVLTGKQCLVFNVPFSDNPKNELQLSNDLFFNNDEKDLGLIDLFNQYLIFIDKIILITINIGGKIISIVGFAISGSTKTPVFFPTI
jgi:hypothetical protein